MLKKKDKVLPIRIEADMYESLKAVAYSQGINVSAFLRYYIADIVVQHEAANERKLAYKKKRADRNQQ